MYYCKFILVTMQLFIKIFTILLVFILISFPAGSHYPVYYTGLTLDLGLTCKEFAGTSADVIYHNYFFNGALNIDYTLHEKPVYQIFAGIGHFYFPEIQIGTNFSEVLLRIRGDLLFFKKWDDTEEQWFKKVTFHFAVEKNLNVSIWKFGLGIGYLFDLGY